MYSNILVPYDKSEHAKHALQSALDLTADNPEANITVLYVAEIPEFDDPSFEIAARMAGVDKLSQEEASEMQKSFYDKQREGIAADTAEIVGDRDHVLYCATSGKPHDAIVEFAKSDKYDLIAMGCRGLGALRGALGSVSFAVLRSVNIPVLIVK